MRTSIKLFLLLLISFQFCLFPQDLDENNLNGPTSLRNRNNIELRAGLLSKFSSSTNITFGQVVAENQGKGMYGAISYTYWYKNNLGLNVYAGVLNADANTSINSGSVTTETAVVIPLLFGVKYEPFNLEYNEKLRPYVTVSAGPFFGYTSNIQVQSSIITQSVSETAIGSFLGAGVDYSISSLFYIGIRGGYFLVTDFSSRIGFEKNYSSPEFSASFGLTF